MRGKILSVISAAVLVFALAGVASAQYETSDKSPVGLKLCLFKPSGAALKSIKGTWLAPMLDWNALWDKQSRPELIVSVGWLGESNNLASARLTPITATFMHHFGKSSSSFYAGMGVGVYFAHISRYVFPYASYLTDSGHPLGVNFAFGRDFGAWYGEVDYSKVSTLSDPAGNLDFSGLALSLGTHYTF